MAKIEIKTKGMHCPSCETLVVDELQETDGVSKAEADFKTGTVSVEFDESKLDVKKIKLMIEKEGYKTE